MSAFAAIFRRDRGPVSERLLRTLAGPLAHRGPDGLDLVVESSFGLAHQHTWFTPEEVGERQPVRVDDRVLVFDGRIDNRPELSAKLDLGAPDRPSSDAELALAAHAAWGDAFCRRLIGPFALVLVDLRAGRALLARDALGDRTLFYADLGTELVIGSEEASLLAHPAVSSDLDETRLLHYFALEVPGDGSTFFRGVTEIEPGTLACVDQDSFTTESFWSPPATGSAATGDGAEFAERYLELLTLAVASRQRSPGPTAIMMSGGLDSTSLAALASESADRVGAGRPRSISWVFDARTECDERAFIRPVVERCGLEGHEFPGDRLGPLPDGRDLCLNPGGPEENPYRRLKLRAYSEAVRAGSTALLNGGSADALYTGYQRWFVDLIRAGRPLTAARELVIDLGRSGVGTGLRRAGVGRLRRAFERRRPCPRWLTPWARDRLARQAPPASHGTARLRAAAGPRAARGISAEVPYAARCGVDLRHPYRDLRLVEFMLSLPAYELYRHGRLKEIARRALAGLLPEAVLTRSTPTLLTPLFDQALRGANRDGWVRLLHRDGAAWPRFVRPDWIEAALARSTGPAGDAALWNCLSFELWRLRFDR